MRNELHEKKYLYELQFASYIIFLIRTRIRIKFNKFNFRLMQNQIKYGRKWKYLRIKHYYRDKIHVEQSFHASIHSIPIISESQLYILHKGIIQRCLIFVISRITSKEIDG